MTTIDRTAAASFFEQALERISDFAREHRARRAQRLALVTLMDMDAARLDDLGLNAQDVVEALRVPATTRVRADRRGKRAESWIAAAHANA